MGILGLSARLPPTRFTIPAGLKGLERRSVFALAALKLRRTRFALRASRGCATRSPQGEAWWACLDSNQEPDRYERPALTIELQAPPGCRLHGNPRCQDPLTLRPAIRQCRGPFHTRQSIFFEELLHASWPDLFRPPAFLFQKNKDVDHRDKPGDDDPSNGALLHRGA